jgi:putative hydrolase of the HAD superfamily
MIRAVIFDFGNVISRFDVGIVLRTLAPFTAKPLPELEHAMFDSTDLFTQFEGGHVQPEEFYRCMIAAGGLAMSQEEFRKAFTGKFTPIPGTADIIRRLKPHYLLGLLSNTNIWDFESQIIRQEVFPLFNSVTLSFEVHALKPARRIYDDALVKLGVAPDEAVYIDDIREYVEAAEEMGMKGIRYTSDADLRNALGVLGVMPFSGDSRL